MYSDDSYSICLCNLPLSLELAGRRNHMMSKNSISDLCSMSTVPFDLYIRNAVGLTLLHAQLTHRLSASLVLAALCRKNSKQLQMLAARLLGMNKLSGRWRLRDDISFTNVVV